MKSGTCLGAEVEKSPKTENEYPSRPAKSVPKVFAIGPPARKRGGQPGNQNARKTGRYDKEKRELRARIRASIKRANAAIAWVDDQCVVKRKRGRPRKNP